jgi:hypothetical protein
MRIVSRLTQNTLNSRAMATLPELAKTFSQAPNMAAKTIRLFPHNALSFFTEGLGEIYDINAKSDNFVGVNKREYKWKIRGHRVPKIRFAARVTGGAITAGSTIGANMAPFIVACFYQLK